jgi:hypothetical protein
VDPSQRRGDPRRSAEAVASGVVGILRRVREFNATERDDMALRVTAIGEQVEDPESGETFWHLEREHAEAYVADVLGTLLQFGGQLSVVAERVKVGELAGEDVMQTRRLLCFYNTSAPLAGDETAAAPGQESE